MSTLSGHTTTTIAGLLRGGCPAAITRLVTAVVVDALNGNQGATLRANDNGPGPHISNEVGERCAPTITDSNATAAVVRVQRVAAARDHVQPGAKLWSSSAVSSAPLGRAMRERSKRVCFVTKTAAALMVTFDEVGASSPGLLAAVADANPTYVSTFASKTNESTEPLIGHVYGVGHQADSTGWV